MKSLRRISCALFFGFGLVGTATVALAQTATTGSVPRSATQKQAPGKTAAATPQRRKYDPYQSPLATIMQSHLRADVPEAQDFVRETRPSKESLKYTPLQSQLGPDPVRPKPRDAANVLALQAELESSIAHNQARVGGHGKKAHRAKSDAASN